MEFIITMLGKINIKKLTISLFIFAQFTCRVLLIHPASESDSHVRAQRESIIIVIELSFNKLYKCWWLRRGLSAESSGPIYFMTSKDGTLNPLSLKFNPRPSPCSFPYRNAYLNSHHDSVPLLQARISIIQGGDAYLTLPQIDVIIMRDITNRLKGIEYE